MEQIYAEGKKFEKLDSLATGEYEECSFVSCDLTGADLSGFVFTNCRFSGCNISAAKLSGTSLRNVGFTDCKLSGLQFGDCNDFLFEVSFNGCILQYASFYQCQLKKARFSSCNLAETDFTSANLSEAVLDNCDLSLANFENTNLEKADLRTAFNFSIDPVTNRIRKAKFSVNGVGGLLHRFDIELTY